MGVAARQVRGWRRALVATVLAVASLPQAAVAAADDTPLSGWLLVRGAHGLNHGADQPALDEQLLQLRWTQRMAGWKLDAKAWAQRETALEPTTYQRVGVRELTLSRQASDYSLTLGRQIVVWGKADGFRLLDVVNPVDLREFVLGDDLRSRIPLWMINGEVYGEGQRQLQVVLVPRTYQDTIPPPGSEFDFSAALPPGAELQPVEVPPNRPSNWTMGARWSDSTGDLDWSLVALRGLSGAPVLFPSLGPQGQLVLRQAVVRRTLLGMAADWSLDAVVLRGELAFSPDEYRQEGGPGGLPVVRPHHALRTLVGLDWTVDNWLISPQLFNVHAPGTPGMPDDPDGTYASLTIDRKFFFDKLDARLFHARSLERPDNWSSVSLQYQLGDHVDLYGSVDLLTGQRTGVFGQFSRRDRAVLGVKTYF